jgi:ABC-2 type transport system permease protein
VSRTIRIIAAKELVEARRDGRLYLLSIVFVALLAGTAITGYQQFRLHADAQQQAQTSEYERWLAQERKNPHAAAHYGIYAFRAPGALAFFDPGLNPYLGIAIWLEAHKQNEPLYRPAQDASLLTRFGHLTPAAVLGALLPLLLIIIAGPAVSGERERGTLRQLLAQGITLRQLVCGKALALAAIALAIMLPILVGFGLWTAYSSPSLDALIRFAVLSSALLIYVAGFVMFCILVSLVAPNARTALGSLLVFWVATTLIAPRVVAELAEVRHPTPSAIAFRARLQESLADTDTLNRTKERRLFALLQQYGVDTVDKLPVNFAAVQFQMGEEHGHQIFDEHYGRLHDGYLAQERMFQRGGLAAPVMAWTTVSNGVAGSDLVHFRHFVDAAEGHRRVIQQLMNDDLYHNPERDGVRYEADPELWRTVPPFAYTPPAFASIWHEYRTALAVLLVWCSVMAAAVFLASHRSG